MTKINRRRFLCTSAIAATAGGLGANCMSALHLDRKMQDKTQDKPFKRDWRLRYAPRLDWGPGNLIERVERADHPVGHRAHIDQGRTRGAAVAGQVDGQHVAAVMGEIAGLQGPDRVVHGSTMDEDDGRQGRIEGPPAGRREDGFIVDRELHRMT